MYQALGITALLVAGVGVALHLALRTRRAHLPRTRLASAVLLAAGFGLAMLYLFLIL